MLRWGPVAKFCGLVLRPILSFYIGAISVVVFSVIVVCLEVVGNSFDSLYYCVDVSDVPLYRVAIVAGNRAHIASDRCFISLDLVLPNSLLLLNVSLECRCTHLSTGLSASFLLIRCLVIKSFV